MLVLASAVAGLAHAQTWVAHYNGPGSLRDVAAAIAVDNSGNVYVTGASEDSVSVTAETTFSSYATIKYNPAGVQEWVACYNGSGSGADSSDASAIAVDGAGNVYVTGMIKGSGTGFDYATVKYNSAGVQQWVARYNGAGNGDDRPRAIAVDSTGNVYVTGRSMGSGTGHDYATIKYNSPGVEQWVARYNGPVSSVDSATAIAVDNSGNVYVTGMSIGLRSGDGYLTEDYATVKYSQAGIQQWVARYDGPGVLSDHADYATGIAVGNSGDVYVTGWSKGPGVGLDYATVKYDSAGVQQWVARYNGPGNGHDGASAIALDVRGSIYVTGWSTGPGTSYDYATVQYSSTGIEQWVSRYSGPGNGIDAPSAIALDNRSNVYVTGLSLGSGAGYYDYATIKYSSSGAQQWVTRYDGPGKGRDHAVAIALDRSGSVHCAGWSRGLATGLDYATIKYDSAGVEQWVARYNGSEYCNDFAEAMTIDNSSNAYVTGGSNGGYATVKYNSAGTQQWAVRCDIPGNYTDTALAIAVANSGNVYVTGKSKGPGTGYDYATIKYSPAGVEQWVARYDGPCNGNDEARAVAIDSIGNAYVTGRSAGSDTNNYDCATVKYNPDGAEQWVARYDGPGGWVDAATALAVDYMGDVYVVGYSADSADTDNYDYVTMKYDATGAQQWVATYAGLGNWDDKAAAIALDNSGNVYVTGASSSPGPVYDYVTIKYNSTGTQEWVACYKAMGSYVRENRATAVAVDNLGNVYVTGYSTGEGARLDYATVKYNSAGVQQWVARYSGPAGGDDRAFALAIDNSSNVYVTGKSIGSGTGYDYATIKYDAAGYQWWVKRYSGPANGDDVAAAIAVDDAGNVYVAGTSWGSDATGNDYVTVKYGQGGGVGEAAKFSPSTSILEIAGPNPTSADIEIRYALPARATFSVAVHDVTGTVVRTLVRGRQAAGQKTVHWDGRDSSGRSVAPGVYFVRLEAGGQRTTAKVVKVE